MRELHTTEALKIHGGSMKAEFIENASYNRCVAGFTATVALFGAAIGVGTTWGLGGAAGFGIGATVGGVAGAYFCER
ncbi:hypothetical protein [Luteibacter sp. CQ10]|uniref:hypothetical protein n=1 Tax=Luteibacter sp. CQ10 TaxID=2805821 RepID=UPI0034A583B7